MCQSPLQPRVAILCLALTTMVLGLSARLTGAAESTPPQVGDKVPNFELDTLNDEKLSLDDLLAKGPVALVVLRGYPGYQCPICSGQVAALRKRAEDFAKRGAKVVLVYPGPNDGLKERAGEFLKNDDLPDPIVLVVDPDYTFTEAYGLRWDAPRETAYPSAFVIAPDHTVRFSKVSMTHGGRAKPDELLSALDQK